MTRQIPALLLVLLASAAAAEPPVVTVARPVVRDTSDFDFAAQFQPTEQAQIRATVGGRVAAVHCKAGTLVRAGDLLLEIDAVDRKQDLQNASASIKQGEAALEQATAALEMARKKTPPPSVANLARLTALREVAAARLEISRATADRVRADLNGTRVVAPFAGQVTELSAQVGDSVAAGSLLATFVQTDPVGVRFQVPSIGILYFREALRKGELKFRSATEVPIHLGLQGFPARGPVALIDQPLAVIAQLAVVQPDFPYEGRILAVDNQVNSETRDVAAWASFPDPTGALRTLAIAPAAARPAALVRLSVGKARTVLLLPPGVVGSDGQGKTYVLTVGRDNKVSSRPVTTGALVGTMRIILDGLLPDDQVILAVARRAQDQSVPVLDFDTADLRLLLARPGTVVQPLRVTIP